MPPRSQPQLDPSFYDPTDDPRYLGPSREELEEAREIRDARDAKLDAHISYLVAIQTVFESENWPLVQELLMVDRNKAAEAQGRTKDLYDFRELKGKVEAYDTLLALPLKIGQSLKAAHDEVDRQRRRGEDEVEEEV